MFKLVKRAALVCAIVAMAGATACDDPTPTPAAPTPTAGAPTAGAAGDAKPGDGAKADTTGKKPLELLKEGCDAGVAKKCVELGDYYDEWEKKPREAILAYKKACDIGHPAGCEKMKGWKTEGKDGQVTIVGGDLSAAGGDAFTPPDVESMTRECMKEKKFESCNELGLLHVASPEKEDRKYAEAKTAFQMACDGGETEGCNNLGHMYDVGDGVAKDHKKAVELFTISCDNGNADGCAKLGFLLDNGDYQVRNREKAGVVLKKACDQGSLIGCTNLGITLVGDAKTKMEAKDLFGKACDGGYPRGCTMLGLMNSIGDGIPQDHKTANELFDKSCKAGHMGGCVGLGMSYYQGQGFEKDLVKAREWFKVACDGGSRRGCNNLEKLPAPDAPAPPAPAPK